MTTLYGIPNCDTIKKARQWLADNNIDYQFHNYKADGIDATTLASWCQDFSLDDLINKRGTTWRKLDEKDKNNLDQNKAIRLMIAQPSLIKRPLLEHGGRRILGFKAEQYANFFAAM